MYEIQKGVPIPPSKRTGSGRKSKYPLEQMCIGDCIIIDCSGDNFSDLRLRRSLCEAAARLHRLNKGVKFTVRTVTDTTPQKIGVWRIA